MVLCILHKAYKQLRNYSWKGSLLYNLNTTQLQSYSCQIYVLQGFNILTILIKAMQCLGKRVSLVFLCSKETP
jgi:hypothetical protein